MGAICKVGHNWFGLLYSWADSKKKSNLMLSIFEPGSTFKMILKQLCDLKKIILIVLQEQIAFPGLEILAFWVPPKKSHLQLLLPTSLSNLVRKGATLKAALFGCSRRVFKPIYKRFYVTLAKCPTKHSTFTK